MVYTLRRRQRQNPTPFPNPAAAAVEVEDEDEVEVEDPLSSAAHASGSLHIGTSLIPVTSCNSSFVSTRLKPS